jgi:hypothetical protein
VSTLSFKPLLQRSPSFHEITTLSSNLHDASIKRVTSILMMKTEDTSETLVFNSTLIRLITWKDLAHLFTTKASNLNFPLLTTFKVSNGFSLKILIHFRAEFLLQTIAVETKEALQAISETEKRALMRVEH